MIERGIYRRCGKRLLDVALAAPALVLLSPVIGLVALLVLVTLGRPVLFRQSRPGAKARLFTLVKFRTMADVRDAAGSLLPDEDRLSRIGRVVRTTSLDELPTLWNVVRGDMSLVGPRPLLARYLERYTPAQARRLEVRPGITGWAQVNGRNALTWEEKFKLDVWYVDHESFTLDLRVLLRTCAQVLAGRGVSAEGHATMPEFFGSETKHEAGEPRRH
jgi:lipopolysaccharide/colanic/teichoic acid biosynthesis glycosyltransferase